MTLWKMTAEMFFICILQTLSYPGGEFIKDWSDVRGEEIIYTCILPFLGLMPTIFEEITDLYYELCLYSSFDKSINSA